MVDPVTSNKAFAQPTRGSDSGTWDLPLNLNTTYLDAILGATFAQTITGADVTLTQVQANNLAFNITGALTANRNLIFPAIGGLFIIKNGTTGAFSLTVKTSAAGSVGTIVPQGNTVLVYLNGTNASPLSEFASGTTLVFAQPTPPIGWTQFTTQTDLALRVVSGNTGGNITGTIGLSAFIAAGALAHTLILSEMPSHNHGVTDPGHTHIYQGIVATQAIDAQPAVSFPKTTGNLTTTSSVTGITINANGGDGPHTHALSDLLYIDTMVCTKN